MLYTSFHILKEIMRTRVQFLFRVEPTIRELHGLHRMSSTFELYRVRKCCMKPETVKMGCEKCLMREHRLREHKWCSCKHQKPTRFIKECLFRQEKTKIPRYQLTETEKLKRHSGTRLKKSPTLEVGVG